MREIKFRAWDKEDKEMIYGMNQCLMNWDGFKGNPDRFFRDIPVMQYTGLKDENGKEAYHKDLVSALGYSNWIIEWYKNGWMLKQKDIENYQEIPKDFIIIGNIYENPELMEIT